MSIARNIARLLRGEVIDSGSGEILLYANLASGVFAGVGLFAAGTGVGWALVGALGVLGALFVMLANRKTLWVAAAVATACSSVAAGTVGWFLGNWLAAVGAGLLAGSVVGAVYVSIARRLSALPHDWY